MTRRELLKVLQAAERIRSVPSLEWRNTGCTHYPELIRKADQFFTLYTFTSFKLYESGEVN